MLAVIPKAKFFVTTDISNCENLKWRLWLTSCHRSNWLHNCSHVSNYDMIVLSYRASIKTHDRRICHGPLRRSSDAVIQASLIRIISTISVSEEESVDVPSLQDLGEIDPVLQIPFVSRAVLRILLEYQYFLDPTNCCAIVSW